jgi:hypothetical protein
LRQLAHFPAENVCNHGRARPPPPGAIHFPQHGDEYVKQLGAERLVTRIVKGFPRVFLAEGTGAGSRSAPAGE